MTRLVWFALLAAGCVYRMPHVSMPRSIPPIDAARLEVNVNVGAAETVEAVAGDRVARQASALLTGAARRHRDGHAARARVDIFVEGAYSIEQCMRVDGMCALALWAAPLGLSLGEVRLSLAIILEVDGRTFVGHASSERLGGLYGGAMKRALSAALDDALARAAAMGPVVR